jgi:LacI family repressor for deo operon, udp, cdd, tsx, nupC, and nupG
VSWSDSGGAYKGAKYLTDLGHRKIVGLFGDIDESDPPIPKVEGFRRAVREAGVEPIECFGSLSTDQFENGCLLTEQLLEKRDDFTALLARNDYLALGAMKALKKAGKAIPGDVSVVGYNDTILAHCADPALTSVRTPIAEAGELAVEQLVKAIEGEASQFPGMTLAVSVTVRSSCAPASKDGKQ